MRSDNTEWLLESGEPWTRHRTMVDLLGLSEDNSDVKDAREAMLSHAQIRGLTEAASGWPGYALKRHNDAKHPIYMLSTLADFGVRATDPGVMPIIDRVMDHQSPQGAFRVPINLPTVFGGTGQDEWTWVLCDAPTTLYALLGFGLGSDERVQRAVSHLAGLVHDNGFHCAAAPELGKFKGPGKAADPCPMANTYALKALAQVPEMRDSDAVGRAAEMLLWHWAHRGERKLFLFGIGSDFRKLKYPFVWYDILHVADVLSQVPSARSDQRLAEMVEEITAQADGEGRYTATSMYRAWKGWSFANKREPSPWLTLLALRIQKRMGQT